MLKVEIVNASQQCSNNMKKKKLMGMEMGWKFSFSNDGGVG
jgi:hypothetical protein